MPFLIAIGFLAVLLAFGYAWSRHVLGVRDAAGIAGMSLMLGQVFMQEVPNALGYVMPMRIAFLLALFMMALSVSGIAAWTRVKQRAEPIAWPPRAVSVTLLLILLAVGLAFARDRGSDPWIRTHYPLPTMIREGFFPLYDPLSLTSGFSYHYGAAMLAAAFSAMTGYSIAVAYALQPLLNAAVIVLCGASIAWEHLREWKRAAVCGLLALGGAGLFWLFGVDLARDLWNAFVLHAPIEPAHETSLRWLAHMIRNMYANPPLMMLGHRATALGIACVWALLHTLHAVLREEHTIRRVSWTVTGIALGAALALNLETSLIATIAGMGAYVGIAAADGIAGGQRTRKWLAPAWLFLSIVIPALIVSFFQGGVLSSLNADVGASSFAFFFDGRVHFDGGPGQATVGIWEWTFFRDFGFPLILLPAVMVDAWKRRRAEPTLLLLGLIASVHFVVPLFVHFTRGQHEMNRLFFVATSISSLLAGIMILRTWAAPGFTRGWKRAAGLAVIGAMFVSSALHLPVRLLFPTLRLEAAPLFPAMPETTRAEEEVFAWIRKNTRPGDLLYMQTRSVTPDLLLWRIRLGAATGRYIVDGHSTTHPSPAKTQLLQKMEVECDPATFARIGIRYFVAEVPQSMEWFEERCDAKHWKHVYGVGGAERPELPQIKEFVP